MSEHTAKIRAKGLEGTGFTEDLAASLFNRVGNHITGIVELQVVDKHGPNLKGQRGIELVITSLEPTEDTDLEEHLRELSRVNYLNRKRADGQLAIDEQLGGERTVADVVASGKSMRPHPFIAVDASQDNPICDVCGGIEASAVHSTQDVLEETEHDGSESPLPDLPDSAYAADAEPLDEQDGPTKAATEADPWEYDGPEGTTADASTVPDPFATPANT